VDLDYITKDCAGGEKEPVLRIWGVDEEQHSVQANVYGFAPYMWIVSPPGYAEVDLEPLRRRINAKMQENAVVSIEIHKKESILYYTGGTGRDFLKIVTVLPKQIASCRTILEEGIQFVEGGPTEKVTTFESNVPFVLRYMIDRGIVGGGWLEAPAGSYGVVPESKKTSNCQIEFDIVYDRLVAQAPDNPRWAKIAPLRILSFDIECAAPKGAFPEPERDPVIMIGNLVTVQGQSKPIVKNVFTFKPCSAIVGSQVLSYRTEKEMMAAWQRFVVEVDPDVVIGYNICNFDFPYLTGRAKALRIDTFAYLGRVRNRVAKTKAATFSSKAYGTRESKDTPLDGRVQFDMMQVVQREHKLSSYSLNSVAARFLGEQKEEVHHSIISDLFNGTKEDRRRLAVYCIKDAYLPQRLLDCLMVLYNYVEMSRVTGVPLSYLLQKGQQIKVVSQLYRKSARYNLVIPCYHVTKDAGEETYEGATVIKPEKGFHDIPIPTLDFASLYPSIMMAHNLCYSTLVKNKSVLEGLNPDEYETTPTGDTFVKATKLKGLLPMILEELLDARRRAKEDLKNATDPAQKAVFDGRQLALKISANSVYGFTGATIGRLPCLEISSSVTGYGRQMIEMTRKVVEETYSKKNGYPNDARVIYGDTDSVMVRFGVTTVAEAMDLGKQAARLITGYFPPPVKLEFEKVYYPYLLINKKRYAGVFWTKPDKYDKLDAKGIESVRRDNCLLVRNVLDTCLKKILLERDVEGAKAYVKNTISDLLQNKLDLSLLVITKALSKDRSEYAAKQAHVELVERMRKRDPHTAPSIGDRVPYVVVQGTKKDKAYEKSEDPLWVLENNIPLDYQYYLKQQLSKPLLRLFDALMPNPQSLLSGDHTRTVVLPTPKTGGIVGFYKKRPTCLGCRVPLADGQTTTCSSCHPREPEVYEQCLSTAKELERRFTKVWTQCQVCQGSLHQTVLCTSRDCPIFYLRKKVQMDLKDAEETLARFDLSW
jgi:DNA polymerase delta subunit 1